MLVKPRVLRLVSGEERYYDQELQLSDEVFNNRERVKKQMALPGEVDYSFVGDSSPEYHAKVEEIVVRLVGEDNIRRREFRESKKGNYTAYKYKVFHMAFEEVEDVYREVCALPGTRFVI